ncbi:hypothetical protein OMB55_00004210 [gamma proteobacterium HIMB55]|nr:hypothetical protein OMB55_00004210 [gamma proteobacterium HIMB55]
MMKNDELTNWLYRQDVDVHDLSSAIVNEVAAVVSDSPNVAAALLAYERTADYVEKLATEHDFEYSCIKAIRVYAHFNTDLNIAVRPENFPEIIKLLEERGWSRRSWWSRFKEDIAERGKRKLVCDASRGLSEIHLYPGLSWHGFEYTSPDDVLVNRTRTPFGDHETYNTNNSLDLIANLGHALFERYKFTAGEVYHVSSIIHASSPDDLANAENIARSNGWGDGFKAVIALVRELRSLEEMTYPLLIDKSILWATWRERFSFQMKQGKLISALLEVLFNWIWSGPVYTIYSRSKKILGGQSGLEKKYGNVS